MVTVIVAEEATFHHTETPAGTITRNRSQRVSVRWSLPRLNSPDLLFTFEESDREVLSSLSANQLRLVAKTTKKDITTHSEVEALLLPAKKKPKKTTKPKTKTTKTEPKSSEKEE